MSPFSIDHFKKFEPQLFRFWMSLKEDQQLKLKNQLNQLDIKKLENQKKIINHVPVSINEAFEPFEKAAYSGNRENSLRGRELIQQGEVGCLLLAGGQGTRLQHSGPKGTYRISNIKNKSLFQLCAEKVLAASVWANRPLRLAIMASSDSISEIRSFFQQYEYFGLLPSQLSFFIQGDLPLLDEQGKLFLKTPSALSIGPDGNGTSLIYFAESGILKEWMQDGIKYINVILIDNPLADPFDAELVGYHHLQEAEITLKCTEKSQPEEQVGVLVNQRGRPAVIEYSEMTSKEKNERGRDGKLKHYCANLSLFCFSVEFIEKIILNKWTIPLHKAWKTSFYVDDDGLSRLSTQPMAWKFETFIFDWLKLAEKVAVLLYPKEQCFAPLKNLIGSDSPLTVREALQKRDKEVMQALTGNPSPEFPFEIATEFYYPTSALQAKWKARAITSSYVEP